VKTEKAAAALVRPAAAGGSGDPSMPFSSVVDGA